MNLSSAVRTAKSVITANSPVLLAGTAIAGVVATGILAAKAGYKARGIIDEAQLKQVEPLTVQDKFKLTWLCYAVPAVTGVSTIASVAGVHLIHTKRHAALAGMYAMSVNKLDEVQKKAEEMLGAKKSQQMTNEMAQAKIDANPVGNHEVIVGPNGNELCYDEFTGRYFMGSMPVIEAALASANLDLAENGKTSLNEFYDYLGLPHTTVGKQLGWTGKPGLRLTTRYGAATTADGRAAISFSFRDEPTPDWDSNR